MEQRRDAMLKRLASRNEQRILKTAEQAPAKKIDLRATEKAFLDSSPSTVDMKTPINPATKTSVVETMSPILSFEEKADKQMVAIATWCNTMLGLDESEEMDLGTTKAEACKRIQKMLMKKNDGGADDADAQKQKRTRRYHNIFEKNDSEEIKRKCRELLRDSGIDESINEILSKNVLLVRNELAIYSEIALQTSLLRVFLCFHPLWLKAALEAIFNTTIAAQPKAMVGAISRFFVEHIFTNQSMLKNKKFAQGSGKPIITALGKEALHRHFLLNAMKLMFLIETAHLQNVIPSLTRIFTKSSHFKCLDDLFSELTTELLSGSSATMKRAFAKIGFTSSYKQSFIENYDYQAKGFESFSDGLILAKLVETVGEIPHGQLLLKLRDPAGDRIRKVNNVKTVLAEMTNIGICTEDVTAANIVAGKKEAVLTILWNIIGVRVAKEKRIRMSRAPTTEVEKTKRRRSAVQDDMSSEVLKMCKAYARELDVEILDLDSLADGQLLSKAWRSYVPSGTPIEHFEGSTLWDKVVMMADVELHITRGIDQNMALFAKTFFEKMQMVRAYNEKAELERSSLSTADRSTSPFSTDNATFTFPCTSSTPLPGRPSFSDRQSMDSTFGNATFTVARESVDSNSSMFKIPKTPTRVTFVKSTIVQMVDEVIEEEEEDCEKENENEDTIVPNTAKKRTHRVVNVFENSLDSSINNESGGMKKIEESIEEETAGDDQMPEPALEVEPVEKIYADKNDEGEVVGSVVEMNKNTENVIQNETEEASKEVNILANIPQNFVTNEPLETSVLEETGEADEDVNASTSYRGTLVTYSLPDTSSLKEAEEASKEAETSGIIYESLAADHFSEISQLKETAQVAPLGDISIKKENSEAVIVEEKEEDKENVCEEKENEEKPEASVFSEEHKKIEDYLSSIIRNQTQFVERNHLEVVVKKEDDAGTPELKKILREARRLKKEQEKVARLLGKIERRALAEKQEEAFIESDVDERSDAGHEQVVMFAVEDVVTENLVSIEGNLTTTSSPIAPKPAPRMSLENAAASIIQKTIRGFLARRRLRAEIEEMKKRAIAYNQVLATEDQMFTQSTATVETTPSSSSAETKLRNYSLYGLTDANLHIVNLAAVTIDRLTDLVPSLIKTFVVDLNGVKLAFDILKVADRGLSYTRILQPLLNVLQKSFVKVPPADTNSTILPLIPQLSPRLFQLLLAHCTNKDFFIPIATTLISIGRRFPNKETSQMGNATYFLVKSTSKVTDPESKRVLITLQTVCDALQ